VEVEAAKGVPDRQHMLRAAQLFFEVYTSCGLGVLGCYVLYPWRSTNFQKEDRANSIVYLSFSLVRGKRMGRGEAVLVLL
jgi:hypothetical protein